MSPTLFSRSRRALVLAAALTVPSMGCYPGGTPFDRGSAGYSLSQNFLSDLGMTVAYGGRPNRLGALLFVLAMVAAVGGAGACLAGFVRLSSAEPAARRYARVAAGVGAAVCAAFVGVAVTPENAVMALHVGVTRAAFHLFPLAVVAMAVATARAGVFPRRTAVGWGALASALAAYALVMDLGPSPATPRGLVVQVIAQKTIAVVVLGFLLLLTVDAERAAARVRQR